MQNIKYHSINIITVLIFSLVFANLVNAVIKQSLMTFNSETKNEYNAIITNNKKSFKEYEPIILSGMFEVLKIDEKNSFNEINTVQSVDFLTLQGTIVGPSAIARAIIKKKVKEDQKRMHCIL